MFAPIITQPLFYVFAVPAVIFLGIAKGGFSGASIAATPLLAIYLPPLEAAALLLRPIAEPDIGDKDQRCNPDENSYRVIGHVRRE